MAKKNSAKPAASDFAAAVWPAEELPFIREIHAHPFDDAPRLVFADWLEERGDLRAEFIRVQCRLAELPIDDPRYPALAEREQTLLEKHRAAWLRQAPPLEAGAWGIDCGAFDRCLARRHFSRGFCAAAHLKTIKAFVQQAPRIHLEELQLPARSAPDVKRLADVPQLSQLGALKVTHRADLSALWNSPHLGPLWRIECGTATGLGRFLAGPHSHRLRWLGLMGTRTPDFEGATGLAEVVEWPGAPQLETLTLNVQALRLFERFVQSRLRPKRLELDTYGSSLTKILPRLATAPALSACQSLRFSDLEGQALGTIGLPPTVRSLALGGPWENTAPRQCSESLRQLEHLEARVDRQGVLNIVRYPQLAGLKSLDVSWTRVDDDVARAIVQSKTLTSLEHLNLRQTRVSVAARAELRKAFRGRIEF